MSDYFKTFPILILNDLYYLRKPILSDAANMLACANDKFVEPFVPNECIPRTMQDAEIAIRDLSLMFDLRRSIYWVIARRDNDQFIGKVGFNEWNKFNNRLDLSYQLNSNYWKHGIMSIALKVVLKFAFEIMSVNRVEANTILDNHASIKLLLKSGFTKEGILSSYRFYKGKFVDIVMFGYTSRQYFNHQKLGQLVTKNNRQLESILMSKVKNVQLLSSMVKSLT